MKKMTPRSLRFWGYVALLLLVGGTAFHWTVNRVWVPAGYSLKLTYKGPLVFGSAKSRPSTRLARYEEGEVGVLETMLGPGRHFYCPIWWDRGDPIKDHVIEPVPNKRVDPQSIICQVGIATSKIGEELNQGSNVVIEGDLGSAKQRGILRKVFGPGRYRVNPEAYDFKIEDTHMDMSLGQPKYSGWVSIPTGYCGVVTNLTDNPLTGAVPGVQKDVLQPGIYPLNPYERKVDIVEIGYREKSVSVVKKTDAKGNVVFDDAGEPSVADAASGINFPSNDGFPINMDFTAIWGILPEQAPHLVEVYGTVHAAEERLVLPQIESICREKGSTKGAVELLVGESRQQFQDDVSKLFHDVMEKNHVTLLYGLVRHIYIPTDVRVPIQNKNIAIELQLTREAEQQTAKLEADLREAERKVELETGRVKVETEKKVAETIAEGQKTSEETRAETIKLVATVDRETAEQEKDAQILQGQAKANAQRMLQEAQAQKFKLAVEAFGSGEAYNLWVFANSLPSDIKLNLVYAGQGTFWTDLNNFVPAMLGKQLQQNEKK